MIGGGAGVGDQVTGNDGVDEDEDDEREKEEDADGRHEIKNGPKCVGLCHAAGRRNVAVGALQVLGDEQHRTGYIYIYIYIFANRQQ